MLKVKTKIVLNTGRQIFDSEGEKIIDAFATHYEGPQKNVQTLKLLKPALDSHGQNL